MYLPLRGDSDLSRGMFLHQQCSVSEGFRLGVGPPPAEGLSVGGWGAQHCLRNKTGSGDVPGGPLCGWLPFSVRRTDQDSRSGVGPVPEFRIDLRLFLEGIGPGVRDVIASHVRKFHDGRERGSEGRSEGSKVGPTGGGVAPSKVGGSEGDFDKGAPVP